MARTSPLAYVCADSKIERMRILKFGKKSRGSSIATEVDLLMVVELLTAIEISTVSEASKVS